MSKDINGRNGDGIPDGFYMGTFRLDERKYREIPGGSHFIGVHVNLLPLEDRLPERARYMYETFTLRKENGEPNDVGCDRYVEWLGACDVEMLTNSEQVAEMACVVHRRGTNGTVYLHPSTYASRAERNAMEGKVIKAADVRKMFGLEDVPQPPITIHSNVADRTAFEERKAEAQRAAEAQAGDVKNDAMKKAMEDAEVEQDTKKPRK